MESSGDMSPQCVCCGGLSSPAVTSLRCARPARDEDVQVILVGFQGDGNERSGHASQYISLYILIHKSSIHLVNISYYWSLFIYLSILFPYPLVLKYVKH